MSGCSSDDAWNVGANWRHGPHQDAQKSTSTMSLPSMVSLNCSAVRSRVVTTGLTSRAADMFPGSRVDRPPTLKQSKLFRGHLHIEHTVKCVRVQSNSYRPVAAENAIGFCRR